MSVQITLTIPDHVYQKLAVRAKSTQRAVADLLLDSALIELNWPELQRDEKHQAMAQEEAAFRRLHAELYTKYPEQFVAFYQGRLVDYDPDQAELLMRVGKQWPTQVVLVTQVLASPEEEYTIRSPRLEYGN